MVKRKIKLLGAIMIAVCTFGLASCGGDSSNNTNELIINYTDEIKEDATTKQKYVIELNMDNYHKYIDERVVYDKSSSSNKYALYGSLSYAFYDNVVVKYVFYSETFEIELSSGGYGNMSKGYESKYKIIGVSGKVIYWI